MATPSFSNLSCMICSNLFTDPRLLPCLHVYCKSCLESLESQNKGTLTCPSCYKTSSLPSSLLPKHIKIEKDVSFSKLQQSGEMVCGGCDDNNKAVSYCEDCSSPICSDCVSSHKRMKLLKSHSVVPLESAKPQPPPVTCGVHPKEGLKYYCNSCSTLICNECIVDHKYHKWIPIDEAASTEKKKLKLLISKMEESMQPVTKSIGKVNGVISLVAENKAKVKEEIDKIFEELATVVERRHGELLKELEDCATATTTQLEKQKEELGRITTGLQLALTTASSACRDYSSVEFLAVKGLIQIASDNIQKDLESSSVLLVCNGGLDLEIKTCVDVVSSLGKIRTQSRYPPLCSLIDVNPELAIGVAANSNCLLTLQTKNSRGEDLAVGGASVNAVFAKPSSGKLFNCEVHDLGNGRYEITFHYSKAGLYEMYITVDGFAVQNSPYKVKVIDYKNMLNFKRSVFTDHAPQYVDCGSNCLYLSTNQGHIEIYKCLSDGELIQERTIPKSRLKGVNQLRGIAVDERNGVMFVASAGANRVLKADLNGNVIATIGDKGLKFQYPTGLCLTKEGLLLVGDNGNKRVLVLGHDLSFVRSIHCRAHVWGVSVDPGGNVHVGTIACVEVFNMDGRKIKEYGKNHLEKAGNIQFPNFQQPSKCKYSFVTNCADEGEIYMYDWTTNTVLHTLDAGDHPLGLRIDQEGGLHVCCYEDQELLLFTQ